MSEELRAISKSTAQEICDAVKEKEGSTEGVPFNTVADRIRALSVGGGENRLAQLVGGTLTEITAEDLEGLTSLRRWALAYSLITRITIPDSVTSIGESAFRDCSGMTTLTIPDSMTSIDNYAFYGCKNIKIVHITDIGKWCEINFGNPYANPLNVSGSLYLNGTIVNHLEIPNTVTKIKNYVFRKCKSLVSVIIPNSVTSIGEEAFRECSRMTTLTISDSVTSIDNGAFYDCDKLASVRIGNGITSIYNNVFHNCSNLTDIYIDAPEDSISGAPWGATNATVHWNTSLPTEED